MTYTAGWQLVVIIVSVILVASVALVPIASAATLSDASISMSDPRPGETAAYTLSASGFSTGQSLQCIDVSLNDAADGGGSIPTGIDTQSFTLDSSSVVTAGSWTEDTTTNGVLRIENGSGETPGASGDIVFGAIDNGTTASTTYYGLVTTYSDSCSTVVNSVVLAFVYEDGKLVELTIEPTLTFTTQSVISGQTVNGSTTNTASTGSGIDFGNSVTASLNGIAAHDLEVSTNATGGYTVYIRHTGSLSNGSDDIDAHAGTNGTPTSFTSAGTESWGYTTEDIAQFNGDLWAGFTTSNEQVIDNATATVGIETTRVGHQVGIDATTPAGTYQTTIVYTVVSTY